MPKPARKKSQPKSSRQQIRLGILALVFLLALILISKFLGAVISLNSPFSAEGAAPAADNHFGWDGGSQLNIIVQADSLYLFSYSPGLQVVNLVKIPSDAYLNLPFSFGSWKASSVYDLGQSENPPIGASLLEKTMTETFGLPINRYLILPEKMRVNPLDKTLENMRQSPFSAIGLLSGTKTDLSPLEYGKLWWGLRGVRLDKIVVTDLTQGNITSWLLLSDGSRVLQINTDELDHFIQNDLIDNKLRDESLTIGVFNATEHPGLAEQAARMISNSGGRVIFATNFPIQLSESAVFGKSSSYTRDKLAQIFAPHCVPNTGFLGLFANKADCSAGLSGIAASRADVNVVVGEDFYSRFNGSRGQ